MGLNLDVGSCVSELGGGGEEKENKNSPETKNKAGTITWVGLNHAAVVVHEDFWCAVVQ